MTMFPVVYFHLNMFIKRTTNWLTPSWQGQLFLPNKIDIKVKFSIDFTICIFFNKFHRWIATSYKLHTIFVCTLRAIIVTNVSNESKLFHKLQSTQLFSFFKHVSCKRRILTGSSPPPFLTRLKVLGTTRHDSKCFCCCCCCC